MPFDAGFNFNSLSTQIPQLNFGSSSSGTSPSFSAGGTAIGAFLNLLNTDMANKYAEKSATKAYERQKELLEKEFAFARDEAQKQRYAASLTSLIQQMKAAGLNLDLMYGGTPSQGTMTSASAPGIGSVQPSMTAIADTASAMRNGAAAFVQERLVQSQADLNEANARKANADANSTDALLPSQMRLNETSAQVNNAMSVKLASDVQVNDAEIQKIQSQIQEIGAQINKTNEEANLIKEQQDYTRSLKDLTDTQRDQLIKEVDAKVKLYAAQMKQAIANSEYLGALKSFTEKQCEELLYQMAYEFGIDLPDGSRIRWENGKAFEGMAWLRAQGLHIDNLRNEIRFEIENFGKEYEKGFYKAEAVGRVVNICSQAVGAVTGAYRDVGIGTSMFRQSAQTPTPSSVSSASTGVPTPTSFTPPISTYQQYLNMSDSQREAFNKLWRWDGQKFVPR